MSSCTQAKNKARAERRGLRPSATATASVEAVGDRHQPHRLHRSSAPHRRPERPVLQHVPARGVVEYAVAAAVLDVDLQRTAVDIDRSEEHTSELQSLMRISYAVFCLKKTTTNNITR